MRDLLGRIYTGVKGNIAVYNPDVRAGDSYGFIHISSDTEGNLNSITTGWMVF